MTREWGDACLKISLHPPKKNIENERVDSTQNDIPYYETAEGAIIRYLRGFAYLSHKKIQGNLRTLF